MSIQDFHSQFVTANTDNPLFHALRRLSEMDDLRSVLQLDGDEPVLGWGDWSAGSLQ